MGHRITNIPGSSDYYLGSITAYAYEAKVRLLGVSWDTLQTYGAVSRETVLAMANGIRQALAADIGMAISGIAGPGGGMPDKPVGLVWIALVTPDYQNAWAFHWTGNRIQNKELSAEAALQILLDYLEGKFSGK